jgi:hyperosmotically inducible periplasmic protein
MNKTYTRIFGPALVLGLCLIGPISAQDSTAKPDNTKVNKQKSPTADNSKSNPGDRTLTAKVRKSLMADKTLSTYAHNVKIITQDGMVTLSGPVRTDAEKSTVEAKAKEIAGADKVVNQITIAPKK